MGLRRGYQRQERYVDVIEWRAKTAFWTLALDERQDLVIVRDAESGIELFRRSIGTAYRGGGGRDAPAKSSSP